MLGEERLQRRGEAARIEHLALVEGAGVQRTNRRGGHLLRAVDRDLGRGDAAGLDVEADDWAGLLLGQGEGRHARPESTERPQTFRPATTQL